VTTYLRPSGAHSWHIASGVWRLEHPRPAKCLALCGRALPMSGSTSVSDDSAEHEPVCATCRRVARS
jgi:hypothetical protein